MYLEGCAVFKLINNVSNWEHIAPLLITWSKPQQGHFVAPGVVLPLRQLLLRIGVQNSDKAADIHVLTSCNNQIVLMCFDAHTSRKTNPAHSHHTKRMRPVSKSCGHPFLLRTE